MPCGEWPNQSEVKPMKISVSYSELETGSGYSNRKAEAALEVEVNGGNLKAAYDKAFKVVKNQVAVQLGKVPKEEIVFEDLPF